MDLIDSNLGSRELREPLYDVVSYAQAAVVPTTVSFFGHTRAANGVQVTNLSKANELGAGEHMQVYRIRVGLLNALAADVAAIRKAYALEVTIAGKRVLTTPLALVPLGGSVDAAYAMFELPEDLKLEIQSSVAFQVELKGSATYTMTATASSGVGVDILVVLDGVHAVPIN